jgi:predicted PurR-regulated permease PerM
MSDSGRADVVVSISVRTLLLAAGIVAVAGALAWVSAFGAVTLFFSVIFLTLFGLIDEPRVRDWIGGLIYRDKRERYLDVTNRIVNTISRYMLGNLAISVICGTAYGVIAAILDLPYPSTSRSSTTCCSRRSSGGPRACRVSPCL